MTYEMSVTFKGDYVEARSVGDKSYETAVALWREITRVCAEQNCYKVLGIAESSTAMPVMDSMQHAQLFKDFAITNRYRIAWAELNKDAFGNLKFLETVLFNRGMLNGRAFDNVEEAKQWLLHG
jgi:hypothetical protein